MYIYINNTIIVQDHKTRIVNNISNNMMDDIGVNSPTPPVIGSPGGGSGGDVSITVITSLVEDGACDIVDLLDVVLVVWSVALLPDEVTI